MALLIHHGHWQSRAKWLLILDGTARTLGALVGSYLVVSDAFLSLFGFFCSSQSCP